MVFVHGQGEQAPMDDLLQLAFSAWETDPRASRGAQLGNIASVPLDQGGLGDLRCLITDRGDDGRQVHFYQFYWAHLMPDNHLLDLWRWLIRLLKRPLAEIPRNLLLVRGLLLSAVAAIVLLALVLSGLAPLRLAGPPFGYGGVIADAYTAIWMGAVLSILVLAARWRDCLETLLVLSVSVVVAGMMFGGKVEDVIVGKERFLKGDGITWPRSMEITDSNQQKLICLIDLNPDPSPVRKACEEARSRPLCRNDPTYRKHHKGDCDAIDARDTCFSLGPSGAKGGDCATRLSAEELEVGRTNPFNWWTAVVAAHRLVLALGGVVYLIILLSWQLVSPFLKTVMTDSARYFSNEPPNVAKRDDIRRSGVALLERLHASGQFDRIIVVAHSLGTVVAYNILDHYWGTVRAKLEGAGAQRLALQAVERASAKLDEAIDADIPACRLEFRRAQREYSKALAQLGTWNIQAGRFESAWLVSDLVTLGSPLTYAKLLSVDSHGEFTAKMNKFYRLPACPPVSGEDTTIDGELHRKLHDSWLGETLGRPNAPLPAAVFAATRWTNIYFTNNGFTGGDIVGGEVAPTFGRGVVDVKIDRRRLSAGFLHNDYWRWPSQSKVSAWQAAGETRAYTPPPRHIERLRQALNLFENPQQEVQLMTPDPPWSRPRSG